MAQTAAATDSRRYGPRTTGRHQALRAIPTWPGFRSTSARIASAQNSLFVGTGSLSYLHAQRVWHEMRETTAQSGGAYRTGAAAAGVRGEPDGGAMAQLGFLSLVAQHLVRCPRCWSTGRSTDRPVDWLSWAVSQCSPSMRTAFGALWRDAGGEGLPNVPPRGVPRG